MSVVGLLFLSEHQTSSYRLIIPFLLLWLVLELAWHLSGDFYRYMNILQIVKFLSIYGKKVREHSFN